MLRNVLSHRVTVNGRVYGTKEPHGESVDFGKPIGISLGGVPAYSSDYETVDRREHTEGRMNYNGVYTGYKFQCVEFARRWLVQVKGITFPDIGMAYEAFSLRNFIKLSDKSKIPVTAHQNGTGLSLPPVGAVILWLPRGYFRHTGHIAIVVGVSSDGGAVFVAEQNVYDRVWTEGRNYSREMLVTRDGEGRVFIHDNHENTEVLGWVTHE